MVDWFLKSPRDYDFIANFYYWMDFFCSGASFPGWNNLWLDINKYTYRISCFQQMIQYTGIKTVLCHCKSFKLSNVHYLMRGTSFALNSFFARPDRGSVKVFRGFKLFLLFARSSPLSIPNDCSLRLSFRNNLFITLITKIIQ